jgi:predicted small secreted protein
MKRLIWVVLSALSLLAGCNTMSGFGQDMQKAGSSIENAAKKK